MFGDQVTVIGVAGRGEVSEMEKFVSGRGVDGFEHIADETGAVWAAFGIASQPAVVFLNDDGTSTTHMGAIGIDGLTEGIEALIAG